jgi:hypothetical protein
MEADHGTILHRTVSYDGLLCPLSSSEKGQHSHHHHQHDLLPVPPSTHPTVSLLPTAIITDDDDRIRREQTRKMLYVTL